MAQNCLNCGKILLNKARLDDVRWAMDPSTHRELERDDTDNFFRCPHCDAKNVVIISKDKQGIDRIIVTRIKE